jgi:hypothetical protein
MLARDCLPAGSGADTGGSRIATAVVSGSGSDIVEIHSMVA